MKTQFTPGFSRQTLVVAAALLLLGMSPAGPAGADTGGGKPKMVELWQPGDGGQRMRIRGRVTNIDGSPVANVAIYFRHADSEGIDWSYHRGYVHTNEKGLYQFGSVIPGNSHRLSHVHVTVDAPSHVVRQASLQHQAILPTGLTQQVKTHGRGC